MSIPLREIVLMLLILPCARWVAAGAERAYVVWEDHVQTGYHCPRHDAAAPPSTSTMESVILNWDVRLQIAEKRLKDISLAKSPTEGQPPLEFAPL